MGPGDLPPEVQKLLGQPTDLSCPCCLPDPHVTPQLAGGTQRSWVPARVVNADRGHLVMVPSDGNGQIGALLESLQPPQHYSHMGIMTRDGVEVRHCTESADWLQQHANGALGYPTDGFYEKAMRFGWPGTITQTIEAAWRSSRGDADAQTISNGDGSAKADLPDLHVQGPIWSPDIETSADGTQTDANGNAIAAGTPIAVPNTDNEVSLQSFVIHEMGFDPVSVPILDSTYAQNTIFGDPDNALPPDRDANVQWTTMWPLVVRPCRHLSTDRVLAALDRVARAADGIAGHYRFHSYVDAFICEDASKLDTPDDWGYQFSPAKLPDPNDPCKQVAVSSTRGLVCSTFVWEAVREANRLGKPCIWLTQPFDRARPAGCDPSYQPPAGDSYDAATDGLFDYPADEIRRTALWFAAALHRSIDDQASSMPWWASPIESAFEFFTDIQDDVANQLGNAFAFDNCAVSAKDDDTWLTNPPSARSCSPDNIVRSWMPPTPGETDADDIHGIYGYNEQVILRPGEFADRPKTVWDFSEGPGTIEGRVFYRGNSVQGAKVSVFCQTTYTNADGFFSITAPSGRYLLTAGAYLPQPAGEPAWYADAEVAVKIPFNDADNIRVDLQDPPEENRILLVTGHADCVNRHLVGHDWWGHPSFTCPLVHLGSYDIGFDAAGSEGDKQPAGGYKTSWGYTIDGGWHTSIDVSAKRIDQSTTNPGDPYPLDVTVAFKLGSDGAGWPFNPEASTSNSARVPTGGSRHMIADLKTGAVEPVRSHIEVDLFNHRQG